jgi:hypothetical protein
VVRLEVDLIDDAAVGVHFVTDLARQLSFVECAGPVLGDHRQCATEPWPIDRVAESIDVIRVALEEDASKRRHVDDATRRLLHLHVHPSPHRLVCIEFALVLQYGERQCLLHDDALVAHVNGRLEQGRPGQSTVPFVCLPETGHLAGNADGQAARHRRGRRRSVDEQSLMRVRRGRLTRIDGHALLLRPRSAARVHTASRLTFDSHSHIVHIHEKAAADARRMAIVHTDAQQHGNSSIDR